MPITSKILSSALLTLTAASLLACDIQAQDDPHASRVVASEVGPDRLTRLQQTCPRVVTELELDAEALADDARHEDASAYCLERALPSASPTAADASIEPTLTVPHANDYCVDQPEGCETCMCICIGLDNGVIWCADLCEEYKACAWAV